MLSTGVGAYKDILVRRVSASAIWPIFVRRPAFLMFGMNFLRRPRTQAFPPTTGRLTGRDGSIACVHVEYFLDEKVAPHARGVSWLAPLRIILKDGPQHKVLQDPGALLRLRQPSREISLYKLFKLENLGTVFLDQVLTNFRC